MVIEVTSKTGESWRIKNVTHAHLNDNGYALIGTAAENFRYSGIKSLTATNYRFGTIN